MNSFGLLKIATSSLMLGSMLTACSVSSEHVAAASDGQTKAAGKQAAALAKKVHAQLGQRDAAGAVANGEKMVSLVPDNALYRQLLGEAYLAAGRFTSAETTLNDSLELSPSNEKVALKLALVKAALGKQQPAQLLLREFKDQLPGTDYGLALALAGDIEGGVSALESVVRSTSSDSRARQNLALTYAMSNRWQEAKVVAEQDLSPDLLARRMTEWAAFVRPKGSWDQVASMLGVKPAYDSGQPVQLALAPRAQPQAVAQSTAPAPQPEPDAITQQTAIAAADPVPVYRPVEAADPAGVPNFAPAQPEPAPLVKSDPQPVKTALASSKSKANPAFPRLKTNQPTPVAKVAAAKPVEAPVKAKPEAGNFAVQLGAFENLKKADAAWKQAVAKTSGLKGHSPSRTAAKVKAKDIVRLAVAGMDSRSEADALCASLRASGLDCFVRATSNGDAGVRMAKAPAKADVKVAAKAPAKPAAKPAQKLAMTATAKAAPAKLTPKAAPAPVVKVAANIAKPDPAAKRPAPKPVTKVGANQAPAKAPVKVAAR